MLHQKKLEPEAQPSTQPSYWTGPSDREIVAEEVERMCEAKLVEPAIS